LLELDPSIVTAPTTALGTDALVHVTPSSADL
jgi:hypothetical protein